MQCVVPPLTIRSRSLPVAALALLTVAALSLGSPAYAQEKVVRIAAVGHVVIATESVTGLPFFPPNNGVGLVDEVAALMADADLRLGNLAAPISTRGTRKLGVDNELRWAFRTPPRFAPILSTLDFDAMLTANNHILDYGPVAYNDTLEMLKSLKIGRVGLIDEVYKRRINGIRVAVIGFTQPYHPDFQSHHDIELAGSKVDALVGKADVIVVLVHGGGEGREFKHVRRTKEFAGREYRGKIVKLAHHLVDRGADLVIGYGSHMPRAMELYEGRVIAYALGNFLTYGPFDLKIPNNLSAILKVDLTKRGTLAAAKIEPLRLIHPGVPHPDPRHWATKYLRKMSRFDFPNSPIVLGLDGVVQFKEAKPPKVRAAKKPKEEVKVVTTDTVKPSSSSNPR